MLIKIIAAGMAAVLSTAAWAWQPTKPVEVTIGFGPGSGNEMVFRILAQQVERNTGVKFVINTRPGAGGVVGTDYFVRQPADGHHIFMSSVAGTAGMDRISVPDRPLTYTLDSFRFVILAAANPFVIVTHPADAVNTPQQLVDALKRERTTFAASGGARLVFESLVQAQKITQGAEGVERLEHKGPTFALTEVAGRHVRFAVVPSLVAAPMIRDGQVKAIAHSGDAAIKQFPRVPNLQAVMPGFSAPATWGILLPKDASDAAVEWYVREFTRAVNSAEAQAAYDQNLLQTIPGTLTSRGFESYARKEEATRRSIVDQIVQSLQAKK